ncbi:hypothetical protein JHK87_042625 [Glycine soja]|nr:hypothetical protein JHK87_042625 [Glycine soja]
MHSITYNQDLVSQALLAGWIELKEFYELIGNHQDVSSTMYSFMKAARFTHLSMEGTNDGGWGIVCEKMMCYLNFRVFGPKERSERVINSSQTFGLGGMDGVELFTFAYALCMISICYVIYYGLKIFTIKFLLSNSDDIGDSWGNTRVPCPIGWIMDPNKTKNSTDNLCTVVTNNSNSLTTERCNNPHASLCILDIDTKCNQMHRRREYFIILTVVSALILSTTLAVVVWLLVYKRGKKRRRSRKLSIPGASLPSWKVFTKEELRSITKNFSEGNRLVGDTKTGGTYSGVLSDGSKVAVKRLKRSNFQRKKEFYSEIGRVARLRHPNLVAVMGCCYDHGDRYIVYEFVANGPLDKWLHHIPRGGRSLDWAMRMKIATTLAQGIAFLHDKVKPQVVHRDIRTSNVLLDEEFGARLMGVGLSKFVPYEVMHERTVMAGGTYGYLAPEFVYRNELTTKSDVYSFGVLLLEIVSGRRPAQAVDSVGWQSIFEWATPLVQAHRYHELLDLHITSSSSSIIPEASTIQKVVDLVYSCTQHVPSMRPRMSHVVHQLQQITQPHAK